MRKFKRAVTDSENRICVEEGRDGIANLIGIYSAVTGKTQESVVAEFAGKGYGDFKTAVGEAVVSELAPLQERYKQLIKEKSYLEQCMKNGAEAATAISQRTLDKVMKKVGFLPRQR